MALQQLEWLNLSSNCIERIQNIYFLTPLTTLYLSTPATTRQQQDPTHLEHQLPQEPEGAGTRYTSPHPGHNRIKKITNLYELVQLEMLGLELN